MEHRNDSVSQRKVPSEPMWVEHLGCHRRVVERAVSVDWQTSWVENWAAETARMPFDHTDWLESWEASPGFGMEVESLAEQGSY
jgi:hypothetical protein